VVPRRYRGRAVHPAYAGSGHNAIDADQVVLGTLRELERRLNAHPPPPYDTLAHPINLNPASSLGATGPRPWPHSAACHAGWRCTGDRPAHRPESGGGDDRRVARSDPFLSAHPPRVRYDGFVCEGSEVGLDEPLVTVLSHAYSRSTARRRRCVPPLPPPTPAISCAAASGVCFGPRAEAIHGIDERVSLSSMRKCAEVLARFILNWCGEAA